MDAGTALQVPGCEGLHAAPVSRCRPGDLAWFQVAAGNSSVEGGAEVAAGQARSPRGAEDRLYRSGHWARGQEPCVSQWRSKECGMSDGLTATHGAVQVRPLQRALSRTSKQDKPRRFHRYVTQRRKGRGFGWHRFPHSKRYAMELASIGSGLLESRAKPVHGVR